jgi:hypothetical protein
MGKFNLSDAAKQILSEGSKETFDGNIAQKRGMRGSDKHPKGEVGQDKLPSTTAYGTQDAGIIGTSPTKDDEGALPDYLKGTPTATPPGATPPVGSEKNDQHLGTVGYSTYKGQPQQTMGRKDVMHPDQMNGDQYEKIRDRVKTALPKQTFKPNPGATFQNYGESIDMSDDVNALLEGESLSEEFKLKATTIFEAAVSSRIEQIIEHVEAELVEQYEAGIEQIKEELADKLDEYIDYFAEQYMKQNELAIVSGLRAEIAEDFMTSLRDVFMEHNIDIPEEQVQVVEELTARVEELEEALDEEVKVAVALKRALSEQVKLEAIHTACEGLTQTQEEKLKSLAEGVEFTSEEEFSEKLNVLKESYFKADVKVAETSMLNEGIEIEEEKKQLVSDDASINQYVKTISQTLVK